ncbi:peptidoglycan-associated lipoprotein Pal [Hydrogenophaga sp. NFH-34]|uniref:peptidoglycan-associated lipoprotein Pal n=1 Tax=Hydrogenophaga sp. NFH-34 TaxID=2744446 RepID=UPI001F3050F1|nr:peptidoglycan-associated lipoprotein Pal [Hydrogenophaga sp. NFH-34]
MFPTRRRISPWSQRIGGLLLCLTLAACGSSVKLDDVPVEDRNAGGAQTGQNGVDPRTVQGVDMTQDGAAGIGQQPVGLARVVYFDYDSFDVRADGRTVIDSNVRYLKANPSRRVSLEGHTDERGGREYNLALGQKRAEAVRRALAAQGVPDAQMEAVSFGEEKPAEMGSDESAYAKNRRVEILYR